MHYAEGAFSLFCDIINIMIIKNKTFIFLIIFLLFSVFNFVQAEELNIGEYAPDEIIVKFKAGRMNANNFAADKNLNSIEELQFANAAVFQLHGESVLEAIERLKNDPTIEYVQPNFRYQNLSIDTNDPFRANLWGLDNDGQVINTVIGTADADIDAPEAWAINEGTNEEVIVAVIDLGVGYNHPDLINQMWDGTNCKDENGNFLRGCIHGYDYGNDDKDPEPNNDSHGTHVSGTIAAEKNNAYGIIGVAPNAKIMALQATQPDGYFYDTEIMKSINFAAENGASVINASFGGGSFACFFVYDEATYEAIGNFPGLFVAAAGNDTAEHDGSDYVVVPSDYGHPSDCWDGLDNVISVAATDANDEIAEFSDYGENFVDVGAPGVFVYSSVAENYAFYETFDSTSSGDLPSSWLTTGGNWAVGSVATFNAASSWGQVLFPDEHGAATSGYYYAGNDNSYITSPIYDLSGTSTEATFNFRARCDTEYVDTPQDYMALEFSADGITFNPVTLSYYGGEKFDEYILDSIELDSDEDNDCYSYFDDVSLEGYFTSNFQFRFHWITDSDDNNYRGCVVDNVSVNYMGDGSDNKYDFYSGTSMAAPHVAGLAALLIGYRPALTDQQIKSVILGSGDTLDSLIGKTVTGKRINAYNALAQSDFPAPPTIDAVDSPTKVSAQAIFGTKEAHAAILLNDEEIVARDNETDWSYELILTEGANNLSIQAQNASGLSSTAVTATIILDTTKPKVRSTVISGYYRHQKRIRLTCNEDCTIYYTRNNTEPNKHKKLYTHSLVVKRTRTIKAVAYDQVNNKSSIKEIKYHLDYKKPLLVSNVKSSTYSSSQLVTLTCNEKKCKIYYTKNRQTPTELSKKYSSAITISRTTYLKARAYDRAGNFSKIKKLDIKIK